MRTAKHDLMRSTNTLGILDCIRQYGPVTKKEIQEKIGLSWGSISNITAELLKKGIVFETKSTEALVGRTPSKLEISNADHLIIGMDINVEGLTVVLVDLKCRVLETLREDIPDYSRGGVMDQAKHAVCRLIETARADRSKVVGIGVAMQGAVDVERGVSVYSPNFTDWKNVPIREILEGGIGMPVWLEHDPNCMALTEKWLGEEKNISNLLFIRLSMGIGLSIMINNEVYRGADGSAGEFGHIIMNPDGPRCTCGNYGCLEAYASGRSLLQRTSEGIKLGRSPVAAELAERGGGLTLETVIQAARLGDAYVRGLLENAGTYLGVGIGNLINIFNPELIVVGGELTAAGDLLRKAGETAKQTAWKNSRVRIVPSKFGSDSAAIGAALVYVKRLYSGELKLN